MEDLLRDGALSRRFWAGCGSDALDDDLCLLGLFCSGSITDTTSVGGVDLALDGDRDGGGSGGWELGTDDDLVCDCGCAAGGGTDGSLPRRLRAGCDSETLDEDLCLLVLSSGTISLATGALGGAPIAFATLGGAPIAFATLGGALIASGTLGGVPFAFGP